MGTICVGAVKKNDAKSTIAAADEREEERLSISWAVAQRTDWLALCTQPVGCVLAIARGAKKKKKKKNSRLVVRKATWLGPFVR